MHTQVSCNLVPHREAPPLPLKAAVRRVTHVSQLATLFEPEVNVVVLTRPLPDTLRAPTLDLCEALGTRTLLVPLEPSARGRAELQRRLGRTALLTDDIFRWVELFADLADTTTVGLRLVQATSSMCPRLHVDRTELRLVLTYRGPGTEFVDSAELTGRSLLPKALTPDELATIDERMVQCADTGDVVLLKGESWPDAGGPAAIHRSPHASAAAPRLVLTLDIL